MLIFYNEQIGQLYLLHCSVLFSLSFDQQALPVVYLVNASVFLSFCGDRSVFGVGSEVVIKFVIALSEN